jgi:MYXO-CTERM domain-containing protein
MAKFSGLLLAAAGVIATAHTALAGPVELFTSVALQPGNPDVLALQYIYGGSGLFLSHDAGATYSLLCYSAVDPKVVRDNSKMYVGGSGEIYIGVFEGVWRGDANGCGFQAVAELSGKFVEGITGDPIDPNRTYAITSSGAPATNGIFMSTGHGAEFVPFGTQEPLFVNTLHVVKNGEGRRFYETAVKNIPSADPAKTPDEVHHFVRYSDDDAKTWTSYEYPMDKIGTTDGSATFDVMAVDPTRPDHIVARVKRDPAPDTMLFSPTMGKPDSWMQLPDVTALEAVTFMDDGTLVFGDADQLTPGLFVIDQPGDMPRQLSTSWKVGCLRYDASRKRMYGCRDWQFGTTDIQTGEFKLLLDMRKADKFVECPGVGSTGPMCERQLVNAYCGPGHWPEAPLCCGYDRPGIETYLPPGVTLADACSPAAGSGGVGAGGMSVAGAAGAPAAAASAKSSGCSCDTTAAGGGAGWALLGLLALTYRMRRRPD